MPYFGYVTHIFTKVLCDVSVRADHNLTIQCVHSTFSFGPSLPFLASPWPNTTEYGEKLSKFKSFQLTIWLILTSQKILVIEYCIFIINRLCLKPKPTWHQFLTLTIRASNQIILICTTFNFLLSLTTTNSAMPTQR